MPHTSDNVAIDLVALAILRHENKIVLVRQLVSADGTSAWVIPGGLVEAGELIIEALIREAREEAGVQIETISHIACLSQIDRPAHSAQTVVYIFEVGKWRGEINCQDPDGEVLEAALVPLPEGIERIRGNGGWPGIQAPLLAYLQHEQKPGAIWF